MLRTLFGCLISLLVCLTALPSWAARGIGPTDGVATTDKLATGHTTLATDTSWCQWIWVTGAGGTGFGRVFDKNFGATTGRALWYDSGNSRIEFGAGFTTARGRWSIAVPATGAWHHLCITYNNSSVSNNPIFYLNDTTPAVTEQQTPVGTAQTDADQYLIGNKADNTLHWNGRIAEVAIWEGTILTSGNVSSLYNSGAGARADSLGTAPTTYWRLCGTASPEPNEIGGGSSATVTGTLEQTHPISTCSDSSTSRMLLLGVK